ncbi:MAG: DUF2817 domain-containing protein [Anaerolineaceae bacterium]|nr:MAG: DUF2817 domain-containing protein [Anaerolineaceae bacterium]
MATIPPTYESSRDRFRASLASFLDLWPAARLTSLPTCPERSDERSEERSRRVADDPALTIDVISADAIRVKQKHLILTTGLHGIEGYVGAGILQLFIEEFLPRLDPETTGITVVHPINPFGMKHRQRVNKNNVDLNRNFATDFETLKLLNPHYESLTALLNPARPLKHPLYEKLSFLWNVARALPKGAAHIREAALMGQYRVEAGIYFGGFAPQEETLQMKELIRASISGYAQVVALDIHSGYGPRWQVTLVNPPSAKETASETAARFNIPRVAGTNPEEFYTIHGDMTDFVLSLIESEKVPAYVGAFEFGTYGDSLWQGIHSLRTTVLENCLRHFGGSDAAHKWMRREYDELFVPSEAKWWDKAQSDARHYFDGILAAEGFLDAATASR